MTHDMRRGGSEARIDRVDLESFAADFDDLLGEGDLWTTDGPTLETYSGDVEFTPESQPVAALQRSVNFDSSR